MHKCDIWAYGLLVWEILADGALYFKHNWRHDRTYAKPVINTSRSDIVPILGSTGSGDSPVARTSLKPEDELVFGAFDVKHLQSLACDFVNQISYVDVKFEKGLLRGLFKTTLQLNPSCRPSDLSVLPIMRFCPQAGNTSPQSKLAMHLKSSELSFEMFRLDSVPEIPWNDQKDTLESLQRIADWKQGAVRSSTAAYQTGFCYMLGFGTPINCSKAKEFLRLAEETAHPMALLFNDRILHALGESTEGSTSSYTSLLVRALQFSLNSWGSVQKAEILPRSNQSSIHTVVYTTSLPPLDFLELLPSLLSAYGNDVMHDLRISARNTTSTISFLEAAILCGDLLLLDLITNRLHETVLNAPLSQGAVPLIQACKTGKAELVSLLLERGADPYARTAEGETVFHWLFCIQADLSLVESQLFVAGDSLKTVINKCCTKVHTMHPQWPLRLHGSPLAFAVMADSKPVVDMLLKHGANPLASAFAPDIDQSLADWTPLHLAIKYHMSTILRELLWASQHSRFFPLLVRQKVAFVCALSFSSSVERYCIHGERHREELEASVRYLPSEWLTATSLDGHTPLMQAIDFDDCAVVSALLQKRPNLSITPFINPEDETDFTYPIHFACQLAGHRDQQDVFVISELLIQYDSEAVKRRDSNGRTCLHIAAAGISEGPLCRLLQMGAARNITDFAGRSALFAANNLNNFLELVEPTTDLAICDKDGLSLVHYAVLNYRDDILRELINRKAPLDLFCERYGTPLHCALLNGSELQTQMLVEAGVDITALDSAGNTALLLAIHSRVPKLVQLLTDHGACLPVGLYGGQTLLQYLTESEETAMLFPLSIHFRTEMRLDERAMLLHMCAWKGDRSSITFLTRVKQWAVKNDDLGSAVKNALNTLMPLSHPHIGLFHTIPGQTPLHTASRLLRSDIIQIFLELGALVHVTDEKGFTPLQLAMEAASFHIDQYSSSRSDVCSLLLNKLSERELNQYAKCKTINWDWQEAVRDRAFGKLTVMVKLPGTHFAGQPIDQQLVMQALAQEEIGFVMCCMQMNKIKESHLSHPPWMRIEDNIVKLIVFACLNDLNMLQWRLSEEEDDLSNMYLDKKSDYITAGGEVRNFKYEWCTLEVGQHSSTNLCRQQNLSYIALVANTKVNVDGKDKDVRKALWWAAQKGYATAVKLLLNTEKVNVNIKDKDGRTPLSYAAQTGNVAVVRLLLDAKKVNIDSQDNDKRTPLSYAAQFGNEAVVKLLLDTKKVAIDCRDRTGKTPLLWAAQLGNEAVVTRLLDTGKVDVDRKDRKKRTALSLAAQGGHKAVVTLLVDTKKMSMDNTDNDRRTPLSSGPQNRRDLVVRLRERLKKKQ